jgi:hypothetical protein
MLGPLGVPVRSPRDDVASPVHELVHAAASLLVIEEVGHYWPPSTQLTAEVRPPSRAGSAFERIAQLLGGPRELRVQLTGLDRARQRVDHAGQRLQLAHFQSDIAEPMS